jgi:hypothetical protein
MSDQPLVPFHPPTSFTAFIPAGVSLGFITKILLGLVFIFWAAYTVVAIYHWFKYSHASLVAIPAIAAHLCVSFALIAFTLSGALPL